jgi:hypothetical protein
MPARTRRIRGEGRLRAIVAASCVGSVVLGGVVTVACGGTTGREGLLLPDASLPGDSGVVDNDADLDSGAFDVVILYADRVLPDVVAPPDATGDAEARYPWPDCPPFIPVDSDGDPVDPSVSINQIPSVYDDAGQVIAAPDGSACAEYPWLGSTAIDDCLTSSSNASYPLLPPCNWCVDAGVAAAGLLQGQPRYGICLDLYACILDSGCAATGSSATACLCGAELGTCAVDASGPCASAELAALEYSAVSPDVLKNFENAAPNAAVFLGFCGGNLNSVLQAAVSDGCFPPGDAGPPVDAGAAP